MKLNKPKFWDKKNSFISILLFPLSVILQIYIFIKRKFIKPLHFKTPIICVGNIYIGGTGKTPTSIFLANEFSKIGANCVILRKYYKSHVDEYNLIKNNFNNLILDRNRVSGVKEAEKGNYDLIILDDGFQDYKIKKNLNIICFNENQLIGNGLVLPSGPLRENLNSLKNANIILINGDKNLKFERKILDINKNLKIFYSYYKPKNIDEFKNKKLLVIAGIANPDNFFKLIRKNNLTIKKKLVFPDHYEFSKREIENLLDEAKSNDYKIVTTEKDYFKMKDLTVNKIDYLKVSLIINEKEKFIKTISKLYDQKN
jgi:tetraacyldisaccharide 4'-kinase